MSKGRTILDAIDGVFAAHAHRVAIEEWPSGRMVTYAQLDHASATLAATLTERGVVKDSHVPIVMPRSADYLIALVATLRAGAAYAPIDPTDPRRDALIAPLDSPVVIGTDPGMLDPTSARSSATPPEIASEADSPAYVMYTSGTTGEPKGVVVPHQAIIRLVEGANYASFGPTHRWAVMSAVAFDASTLEVWGALLHGGCAVVQCEPTPSLDHIAHFFAQGKIGHAWLTAALFNTIIDERPDALSGLKQLLTGGERESVPHIRRCIERYPNLALIHGYGPTENTTFSLCHRITLEDARNDRIHIGTPISGSRARIVAEGSSPDAPPTPLQRGELLVGGQGLALGYLNDVNRTAEKFVVDHEGERWYRTGDLVEQRDDGRFVFLGRIDRQIKIRGHRIEPEGVEHALIACDGVHQATVVIEGASAESRQLIAFAVLEPQSSIDTVRSELSKRLPRATMPNRIIAVERIPVGRTGKIDHEVLLAMLKAEDSPVVATTSPMGARLLELFSARLGHPISANDRFQDAGGHSLLAMRLSADIQRELGIAVPAAQILRLQTIAKLVPLVEAQPPDQTASQTIDVSTHEVGDIRRRTSLEHDRDPTGRAMLVHHALHVVPGLDIRCWREAWLSILARHDALRTRVIVTDQGAELREFDPKQSQVFHAEQDRLDAPDPSHSIVDRAANRTLGPDDPPARMHIWDVKDGSQLVLMVFHHAAIDEWSLDLITRELRAQLEGDVTNTPAPYETFIRAEKDGSNAALAEELAQKISSSETPTRELPRSGPQPGQILQLDRKDLTAEALDARARELEVNPAAVALAALGRVLDRHHGQPGRWVLTPIAKRPTEDLQRVVGLCLDMRPIEVAGVGFRESSRGVHEQLLEAQEPATLPLEQLIAQIRTIAPDRSEDATRFGFTYRFLDDAPLQLSSSVARTLTVRPTSSRFGLCMHIERRRQSLTIWFEAASPHYSQETLRSIGDEVVDEILGITNMAAPPLAETPSTGHTQLQHPGSLAERRLLHGLWTDILGTAPRGSDDFFLSGGTSLNAMRLGAMIHKRTGRKLLLNQFLRNPTFDGLAESVRDDPDQPFAEYSRSKSADERDPWCVAIPGSAGRALDFYRLWSRTSTPGKLPKDMLAFDLSTIATAEPTSFEPGRFLSRFTALTPAYATRFARRGPVTILGYSLGGLVAMDMARKLADLGHTVDRVVLLDAYAPAYLSRTRLWYLAKANAKIRQLGSSRNRAPVETTADSWASEVEAHSAEASQAEWKRIHEALSKWTPPVLDVPVVLVRSASAWNQVRPVYDAETNGLSRFLGTDLDTRVLHAEHLSMLTGDVEAVVDSIIDFLTISPRVPKPKSPDSQRWPSDRHPAQP